MAIGVVQELGSTQKGAPFVVIDGQRYYAGKCDTSGMSAGMKVEYTSNPFGTAGRDGKHPQGLQKWRPVLDASGAPQTASTISEADILRSVSNVVGNACAAGTVKTPEELAKWFSAAYNGFMNLTAGKGVETELDDSDKLPEAFYQGSQNSQDPGW